MNRGLNQPLENRQDQGGTARNVPFLRPVPQQVSNFTGEPPSASVEEPRRDRLPRMKITDGDGFLQEASDRLPEWFWHGVIPAKGITILGGDPMVGKTALSMYLSAMAHSGGEVAGRGLRPARVIYAKLEHLDSTYRDLLRRAVTTTQPQHLHHWHIVRELDLDDDESIDDLAWWADDVEADLIFIDSLRRAHRGEENSSQDAAELMRRLQRLTSGGQRGVVVLHHLTKNTNSLRGSADFMAGADAVVTLTKKNGALEVDARNHAGPDTRFLIRIHFTEEALTVQDVDSPDRVESTDQGVRQAIMQACASRPVGSAQLRSAVRDIVGSVENGRIDMMVRALEAEGLVRNQGRAGRNQWVTMPPGGVSGTAAPRSPSPVPVSRRTR